jgi:sulfate transport system substrate-binding protein
VVLLAVVIFYVVRAVVTNSHAADHLVVYAFSTQEEVFTQAIFPAFEAEWETQHGSPLTIDGVFGPSGTLAGQINLGAPADIAIFSNANHANWLKFGRLVSQDFEPLVLGATPIVIVARPGNPLNLASLADLGKPGLQLLHADPRSSGVAEWAVLAEYGSALLETGDPAAAQAQLEAIWQNVHLISPSARAALTLFELGAGDALLTYEQDARLALERGIALEIVVPERTIVARPVAVIVEENVKYAERELVRAFVDFLLSPSGQGIFRQYYLRPVPLAWEGFPALVQPFTEDDLGGWSQAYTELVEQMWQTNIEPELDLEPIPAYLNTGR